MRSDVDVFRKLILNLFYDLGLLLENMTKENKISDDILWALCRNLDLLKHRYLRKFNRGNRLSVRLTKTKQSVHPAVREYLRKQRMK